MALIKRCEQKNRKMRVKKSDRMDVISSLYVLPRGVPSDRVWQLVELVKLRLVV